MSRHVALVPLMLGCCAIASAAEVDRPAPPAAAHPVSLRRTFVIGAPGRLPSIGDRRRQRRWQHTDSAVAAYADVEELEDPTWLQHEIEWYARRVADCTALGPEWCRRATRQIDAGRVLYVAAGIHAEVVWLADRNKAVRLGWRRVVETSTGTMTVDEPPADFATELLSALPSQLNDVTLDAARDRDGDENEVDRLLYYVDRALASVDVTASPAERRRAQRFVSGNLRRIAIVRGLASAATSNGELAPPSPAGVGGPLDGVLPASLAEELGAVREWRMNSGRLSSADTAAPWCAALILSALP